MKKIMMVVFGVVAMGSAIAESVYEVGTSAELSTALMDIKSVTEDVKIKLTADISLTTSLSVAGGNEGITIRIIGPATITGSYTTGITVGGKSKVVFKDLVLTGGTLTVSGLELEAVDCTITSTKNLLNGGSIVERSEAPDATAFPEETVVLASSQRQVYFGFPALKGVTAIAVKKSATGADWETIGEDKLERRNESSPEPTQVGWQSIRYLDATPGETAHYKLVATTATGTFESSVKEVTTAAKGTLHSRPNAKATIYLDFDGYVDDYKGNAAAAKLNYIKTPKYTKRDEISKIWRSVAEDFAIFDVDVTTEEPTIDKLVKSSADDGIYGKRVVFDRRTGEGKWYVGAGGVSGLGAFGFKVDRPAFIFGETTDNVACQATHEVSHTLGLVHDGGNIIIPVGSEMLIDGEWVKVEKEFTIESEYYTGQKVSKDCFWYPVMGGVPTNDGADYINQFSNGDYESATNDEDDFAVITGGASGDREGNVVVFPESLYPNGPETGFWKLRLLADDVGDDILSATSYEEERMALISPNDVDVFCISAKAGKVTLKVSPEYEESSYGSSLDAKVELLDKNGEVLASSENPLQGDIDDGEFRKAELEWTLPQDGVYYIRVSGTYHEVKGCATSAYGSVGPYKLAADYTVWEKSVRRAPLILVK